MSFLIKSIVSAILLALLTGLGLVWIKTRITGHGFTTDTKIRQFIVGNDVVDIPINMLRFERQRQKSVLSQADLVMSWSDGSGFNEQNRGAFLHPDHTSKLIFMTLAGRELHMEMNDRLIPIYSKLLSGMPVPGPTGLIFRQFKPGSGYDGEELAISGAGHSRWVARCQRANKSELPTCMRDVFVGSGLSLTYRFSRSVLPRWRDIEKLVRSKMSQMIVTDRSS